MSLIEVIQSWLQDKAYKWEIVLTWDRREHCRRVDAETLQHHVDHSAAEARRDRHRLASEIAEDECDEFVDGSEQERWLESEIAAGHTVENKNDVYS